MGGTEGARKGGRDKDRLLNKTPRFSPNLKFLTHGLETKRD